MPTIDLSDLAPPLCYYCRTRHAVGTNHAVCPICNYSHGFSTLLDYTELDFTYSADYSSSAEHHVIDNSDNDYDHDYDDDDDYDDNDTDLEYYSYNPGWRPRGTGPAFFGMECEITAHSLRPVRIAREIMGDLAVFKDDGSVDGFEMVTHPMSYRYAMDEMPWEVFPALEEAGCSIVPETNGIHIHVSKTAFRSPAHVYRWMKLIYRNEQDVVRMARRRDNHWAAFDNYQRSGQFKHVYKGKQPATRRCWLYIDRPGTDDYCQVDLNSPDRIDRREYLRIDDPRDYRYFSGWYYPILQVINYDEFTRQIQQGTIPQRELDPYFSRYEQYDPTQSSRYAAINTTNDNTYEVRIFASTLKDTEAKAAIQLCASSVDYTRTLTSHDVLNGGWDWAAFKSFVQSDDTYPELAWAMDRSISWSRAAYLNSPRSN